MTLSKIQIQQEIKNLEQQLSNSNLSKEEKTKIQHWKILLEQDLKNYD